MKYMNIQDLSTERWDFRTPRFSYAFAKAREPGPQQKCCRRAKRGEGYSPTLNRGAIALPRSECLGSVMKWRGVGDKLGGEGEARRLTKGG